MNNSAKRLDIESEENANSLSSFFDKHTPAGLNSCDREQVHLLGAIQREGALLIVRQDSHRLVGFSPNVIDILSASDVDPIQCDLKDINDELDEALSELRTDQEGIHSVLDMQVMRDSDIYDVVVHGHQENWLIEFLPTSELDARSMRRSMRIVSRECGRMLSTGTLDEAFQIACDASREITGFSRVKIYQFLPDWSGEVIAESRADHMPSYLGLHFPDTDIPKQARALFELVPYRAIFSVNDDVLDIHNNPGLSDGALDLSFSLLRSASLMHTSYLRNMGVQATFSMSLFVNNKLWGLIACHHDQPSILPFDTWTSLREIGLSLSSRISYEIKRTTSNKVLDLRKVETNLAGKIREKGNLLDVVEEFGPLLMQFMNADGFAFQYGDQIHLSGHTPPKEFIAELIQWVQNEADEWEQYQTCSLHKQWPNAEPFKDSACGVLLQPVALYRTCQMVWFRKPLSDTVSWAGKPTDKFVGVNDDQTAVLLPRNSFAAWIGTHNDFCKTWTEAELVIAREILREILDILASLLMLSEENSRLKSFAASAAAHDIKAPLRQIEMALSIMEEDEFDKDAMRDWHDVASNSTRILKNVSTGILDYMSVPDAAKVFPAIELADVFEDVNTVIATQVEHDGATVTMDINHSVMGEKNLVTSLFLNLIYNALNYCAPGKKPVINVSSCVVDDQWIEVSVTDNGLGVPVEFAEQIFNPTERLKEKEGVEGSGLGLSICRRIVNIHKGKIYMDRSFTDGARFIVRLPRAVP